MNTRRYGEGGHHDVDRSRRVGSNLSSAHRSKTTDRATLHAVLGYSDEQMASLVPALDRWPALWWIYLWSETFKYS